MDKYRGSRLYLAIAILFVLMGVLAACDSTPTPQPTPIGQSTVQPTAQVAATVTVEAQATAPATLMPTSVGEPTTSSQATVVVVGAGDPAADFAAGVAAYNSNDFDAAIAAFNKAIESSPEFQAAYVNGSIAYFAKGDNENAYSYMTQALSLDQEDAFAVWCYGLILYRAGAHQEAYEAFDYLIQLRPSDPTGYYWRGNVYLAVGDPDTAYFDFEEAAALSPDSDMGKGAAEAIAKLNNGEEVAPAQAPLPAMKEAPTAPPLPVAEQTEVPAQPGNIVADLGFRPDKDGFSFPNWGAAPDRTDLTPDDMRRMFGDKVCASVANGCNLTSAAQSWMEEMNGLIRGGHCDGFAALSLLFYQRKQDPSQFGAASVPSLNIEGNTALQREIAYYWATQLTPPTHTSKVRKTPAEILDLLIETYKAGANAQETYALLFFKPGFQAGHSITPYAVQDRGNGQYAILVYDNNWPGKERAFLVDRNANTWQYEAAINPNEQSDLYQGDASTGTMILIPTTARIGQQVCNFCEGAAGADAVGGGLAAQQQEYNQLWLDGEAHLLITDKEGRRTGFVGDSFVQEIPGIEILPIATANLWSDTHEPVYFVPTGIEFSLTIESTEDKDSTLSSISMIGPGYVLSVEDITLDPGQKDTILFAPDGDNVTYKTDYKESPDIFLGTTLGDADYAFLVKGVEIESGSEVSINLDTKEGWLALDTVNNKAAGTYGILMERTDAQSEQLFGHSGITLQPNDVAYVLYGEWKGDGTPLPLGIDRNNDGTLDETLELTDAQNE